ncbi:MAG: hypothetical protein Kow0077_01210 [Anaerolineae bacterium]
MADQPSALARRRVFLRRGIHFLQRVFSRSTVEGVEHIPPRGPALLCFNHLSILDGPLVVANVPYDIELVGPGDFPMTPLEEVVVRAYGITRINRGRADRTSLRALLAHLRAGRLLAMAPDGGTWEKPILQAKTGAAYLSQQTGAPIIPVGLGGLYEVPVVDVGKLLTRPRISIRFGEPMPPVPPSADRRQREADLEAVTQELMSRIYALLPPEDQARYDHWARAQYALAIDCAREGTGEPVPYAGPDLPDMTALAEFIAKPNLFRPMWVNAGLLVDPFRFRRFYAPMEVRLAARDLYRTLTHGAFDVYLHYRLGNEKAALALAGIRAIRDELTEWALGEHVRLRLSPVISDPLNPS